jgi:hypothetical protein
MLPSLTMTHPCDQARSVNHLPGNITLHSASLQEAADLIYNGTSAPIYNGAAPPVYYLFSPPNQSHRTTLSTILRETLEIIKDFDIEDNQPRERRQ